VKLDSMSSNNSKSKILDAAVALISKREGADVSMGEIATEAGVSRQAMYLHFAHRGDLMLALVRHVDEKRGLAEALRKVHEAPSGLDTLSELVALQARMNPDLWAIARTFDAVRRTDPAVEQAWKDRLNNRLKGARRIVARLHHEGSLKPGLTAKAAADILWSITSLRTWEDFVLQRGWSAVEYQQRVTRLVHDALIQPDLSSPGHKPRDSRRKSPAIASSR